MKWLKSCYNKTAQFRQACGGPKARARIYLTPTNTGQTLGGFRILVILVLKASLNISACMARANLYIAKKILKVLGLGKRC